VRGGENVERRRRRRRKGGDEHTCIKEIVGTRAVKAVDEKVSANIHLQLPRTAKCFLDVLWTRKWAW